MFTFSEENPLNPCPLTFTVLSLLSCLLLFPYQIHAQDPISIDIKTSFGGKVELAPVEVGAAICLNRSNWANVTEVGEDYSLWLKEYERIKDGRDTRAELTAELRTPAFLRSGSLVASRQVTATFRPQSDGMALPDTLNWSQEDFEAVRTAIAGELSESASDLKREALVVGATICQAARSLADRAR